ncbi:glycosyltransferase family 4 protein [Algoriphagus limi]|uniref:Glycosyltransferase family 4 protein n=1 Tax=Algoriphagus limi TaxID=2975273 RepID=A0ABT2G124_9BACT|nr:glycosyltransferase family 4 protein [Algoriphagus limi]MCS5488970.1 glycosyltransferase family 4 protein [Algoriphagus limi]
MYPSESSPNFGVFVRNFENEFPDDSIQIVDKTVIYGKKKGFRLLLEYVRFIFESIQKLNRGEFDLVYVHFLQHSLIPFHFWKNRYKKKIVLNAHGTDILGQGRLYKWMRKWNLPIFRNADLVIVPSYFFVSKLTALVVEKEKIEIYPSGGINPKIFYSERPKEELFYRIGYLGRLDRGKGLETLIRAFAKLSFKELQLEICGPGVLEADLKKLCETLNISSKVKFLGNIPQDKIRKIFLTWDAFVFPSELEESLGLVGLEAMACGLPVIGSGKGGMATYLDSGKNGIDFEPGNVIDLKEKILEFYVQNQEFRLNLSRGAIATANRYRAGDVNSKLRKKVHSLF